jgi:hypothetical protein
MSLSRGPDTWHVRTYGSEWGPTSAAQAGLTVIGDLVMAPY